MSASPRTGATRRDKRAFGLQASGLTHSGAFLPEARALVEERHEKENPSDDEKPGHAVDATERFQVDDEDLAHGQRKQRDREVADRSIVTPHADDDQQRRVRSPGR